MKVYHNKKLRHILKWDGRRIETDLEYKKGWFWKKAWGYCSIHFEIRPDPDKYEPKEGERIMYRPNPMVLQFRISGHMEVWDESTFHLNERLAKIASEYMAEQERIASAVNKLNREIKQL